MGKWSYSNGELTELHNRIVEKVKSFDNERLEHEFDLAGAPSLVDFALNLWNGSSGDGWACIDNSSDNDPGKIPFQMHVPHNDLNNNERMQRWCKRACVAANRYGVKRKPYVVAMNDEVSLPATLLDTTTLTPKTQSRFFDVNDMLRAIAICGISYHASRGEYVFTANAQELSKLVNTIREMK